MDFIVPILKIFWGIISSFTGTINANISLKVNTNILYILSGLAIAFIIIFYIIKYGHLVTNKKKFAFRLFMGGLIAFLFISLVGYLLKKVSYNRIHIIPIEGFIYKKCLGQDELKKKLAFYGIQVDEKEINTKVEKIPLQSWTEGDLCLHYTLYNTKSLINVRKKIDYKLIYFPLGTDTQYKKREGYLYFFNADNKDKVKVCTSKDKENEKKCREIDGKKGLFGIYTINGSSIINILKKENIIQNDLFILKLGNNIYISPWLVYRMSLDKEVATIIKKHFFIPYIFFILDNEMKSYFIYHKIKYYTFTFTNKSLLLFFLTEINWQVSDKLILLIGDEPNNKNQIVDYMTNNKGGIGTLLLSFLFAILAFFLSYASYVLYIFVPAYSIYIVRVMLDLHTL